MPLVVKNGFKLAAPVSERLMAVMFVVEIVALHSLHSVYTYDREHEKTHPGLPMLTVNTAEEIFNC